MGKSLIISSQSEAYIAKNIQNIFLQLRIAPNNSADVLIIKQENKQSIGIEQMKNLKSWSITKPYFAESKLAIIEKADLLTEEAQNSILKLLEEPNPSLSLILTTENYKFLLPTIVSRCELIRDEKQLDQVLLDFVKQPVLERLIFVRTMIANKKNTKSGREIKDFLTNLLYYYRENLMNNANMDIIRFNINLIQETDRMLNANVLPKLALENLVINLK